jgi:hypothetical protein
MRWLVISVALMACSPELDIDVYVSLSNVSIQVGELDNACTCSNDLAGLGTCTGMGDLIMCTCQSPPGSCLDRVAVVRDGTTVSVLADNRTRRRGTLVDVRAGDSLEFEGCGGSASVPLDIDDMLPVPTIEAQASADTIDIAWTSDPPAETTIVSVLDGLAAGACHDVGGSGQRSFPYPSQSATLGVTIQPLAQVRTHVTALGTIRVWRGASDWVAVHVD